MRKFTVALATTSMLLATVAATPASAAECGPAGGQPWATARPDRDGDFIFTGKGSGHGVGLSQYGALGAAKLGCSHTDILTTYYSGVSVGRQSMPGRIRVGLVPNAPAGASSRYISSRKSTLTFTNTSGETIPWHFGGGVLHQPKGATWRILLKTKRSENRAFFVIEHNGKEIWRSPSNQQTPGRTLVAALDGRRTVKVGANGHEYLWGRLELHSSLSGMTLTADVDFERYLRGLAEMPSSWPDEALKSQAIVGRAYAAVATRGSWKGNCRCDLYDSVYDQAYTGYDKESEGTNRVYGRRWVAAVDGTTDAVIHRNGSIVTGNYASSHGGHSEDVEFVWGGSASHLRAVDDSRWEAASGNPNRTWTARFSRESLGRAFGVGTALKVELPRPRGASGRIGDPDLDAGGIRVIGTQGTTTVSGNTARSRLGLRSTLFTVINPPLGGTPVTGDWDGDGDTDLGWFRDGDVALRMGDGKVVRFRYGRADDIPIVGDWNKDGVDTLGIVRAGGEWHLINSHRGGSSDINFIYGRVGSRGDDLPLVGDWNGNGQDTVGIVRDGQWHLRNTLSGGSGQMKFIYGRIGPRGDDLPLVGDWNGNGQDTVGIVRDGQWHLRNTLSGGQSQIKFTYGRVTRGDVPVTGDWDGDGDDTAGITRGHGWHLRNSNTSGSAELSPPFPG